MGIRRKKSNRKQDLKNVNDTFFNEIQKIHVQEGYGRLTIYRPIKEDQEPNINNMFSMSLHKDSNNILVLIGTVQLKLRDIIQLKSIIVAFNKSNEFISGSEVKNGTSFIKDKQATLNYFSEKNIPFPDSLMKALVNSNFIETELKREHSSIFLNEVKNL